MADNNTSANFSVLGDSGGKSLECSDPLELITAVVNAIAFLINTFHLGVTSRLGTLKGTPYRCVLINIALADIVHNAAMTAFYICYKSFMINFNRGELELRIPLKIIMFLRNFICYHVFALASMEKYLGICKPFNYESSVIVRRLPVNFVIVWLYVFSLSTVFAFIKIPELIPWMNSMESTVLQTTVMAVGPNLLSGILLIKVYKELKRMKTQSHNSSEDDAKTKAAMYLIIIFALEMIVFILNLICMIVNTSTGIVVICKIWSAFIKAPYTILNTVIYGWRTQSYRQYVHKLIDCNRRRRIGNANV